VEASLQALDRGEGDAVLVSRLNGLMLAHRLNLDRITPLPAKVEGYEVRYCLAVRRGDRALLAKVNEGLANLVRTGKFDAIYQRWFGHIEPASYSGTQVMGAVAAGLALALLVALWATFRQRALRQRIAGQAQALRASEERYRGLFEGAYDGLLVLDFGSERGELLIEQTNPAARRLLQTGSGPAPGTKLRNVLVNDPALLERLNGAMRNRQAIEFEHEKPGATGWWRISVSPLGNKVLVWLTDITEQTQVRQRLQKQDEHLRNSQKLEAIGTLAGGIAHDFNNLLTTILGNTQLMLMDLPPNRPEAESLGQIEKASRRARLLVQQILTFSRQAKASRQAVRLGPMIDEVVAFLRAVARGTVEFEHVSLAAAPEIPADPTQVHQVLMNLGTNAVQAMRGTTGRLTFTEELVTVDAALVAQQPELKPGRYLRVTVRDTGPGMSPEIVARIFEPFFTTKPAGEGTGLGLSVVHGIMQQHGGAVTVYSEPGRGTCFHLYFPLATTVAIAGTEERAPAVPAGAGQRLLFVDDDPVILETVRKILQRLGYEVSAHLRADDALVEFEAAPDRFALVLSDLTMPGLNGLQLATRVRARRAELPVMLFSGFWSEADLAATRTLGVTATLYKPISYEILGRSLAQHLPRNATVSS
ncbi:MAG TPA: ATP-binding protein, partial [Candidatus Didemnitutus sp.]|nr:ATP-binding protein [Candidatus Didemnitutus sp.]